MAFGGKKLLTVDWDTQDLRMALVQPRGSGIELLKAVSVPVPKDVATDTPERFGAFLREAIRQSRISNKQAVFCVPREQVVLNTINLPPSPADDLPAIVLNQIARELPFSSDQAVIDFALATDHDPKEPATALVAAVRIDDIEFYRKVASEAGLTLARIGLRPYANRLAVMSSVSEAADQTVLVVESGPHHTEINVLRDGALVFSRSAMATMPVLRDERTDHNDSRITTPGVLDARESEHTREAISRLMVEIIRSFEAYRATDASASVDHIVVCGATGLEAELAQSLAARFAARAELFAPDRALDLSQNRAKELRGFSAVLGLAMGHGRDPLVSFDFLAPKKPVSRRAVRMRKVPRVALTATFLIAATIAAYVKFVHEPVAAADTMRLEVVKLQPDKERITDFRDDLLAPVNDWYEAEQYWPEILATLTREFPPSNVAQVTRISFDTIQRGKRNNKKYVAVMDMKLRTAELGVVNDITTKLRKLGFKNVIAGSESPIRGRSTSVYGFETSIKAEIPPRKPGEANEPAATDDADAEDDANDDGVNGVDAEMPGIDNDRAPTNESVSSNVTTSGTGASS